MDVVIVHMKFTDIYKFQSPLHTYPHTYTYSFPFAHTNTHTHTHTHTLMYIANINEVGKD